MSGFEELKKKKYSNLDYKPSEEEERKYADFLDNYVYEPEDPELIEAKEKINAWMLETKGYSMLDEDDEFAISPLILDFLGRTDIGDSDILMGHVIMICHHKARERLVDHFSKRLWYYYRRLPYLINSEGDLSDEVYREVYKIFKDYTASVDYAKELDELLEKRARIAKEQG